MCSHLCENIDFDAQVCGLPFVVFVFLLFQALESLKSGVKTITGRRMHPLEWVLLRIAETPS